MLLLNTNPKLVQPVPYNCYSSRYLFSLYLEHLIYMRYFFLGNLTEPHELFICGLTNLQMMENKHNEVISLNYSSS